MNASKLTIAELLKAYERYEKLRCLNVPQYAELFNRNLVEGIHFDCLVDGLPGVPFDLPGKDPDGFEEVNWVCGNRAAWVTILRNCLSELGYGDMEAEHAKWIVEREDAVRALRSVCKEHGDNDWPNDMALSDVIDKHLGRHLDE